MNVTRRAINHACRFKDYRASHRTYTDRANGTSVLLLEKLFDDETRAREGGNGPDYRRMIPTITRDERAWPCQ